MHSAVKKSTNGLSLCLSVCKGACVYFPVCLSVFVSARGTKVQNKPEVAWQHKALPNVNFEDVGTAGGGERRRKKKKKRPEMESRKKDVVTAMHYSWFWEKFVSETSTKWHRIRYECVYSLTYVCMRVVQCVSDRVDLQVAQAKRAPIHHRCVWEPLNNNNKHRHKIMLCYRLHNLEFSIRV